MRVCVFIKVFSSSPGLRVHRFFFRSTGSKLIHVVNVCVCVRVRMKCVLMAIARSHLVVYI